MDSAKLNDWLQVVGQFGVIASLIFVGLQLKQDREIALAATYQDRSAAVAETISTFSTNNSAMSAVVRNRFGLNPDDPLPAGMVELNEGLEPITVLEGFAAYSYANAMWHLWDNSHFQYQSGFLPESHWQRVRSSIKGTLSQRTFHRFAFEVDPDGHRQEFREEIYRILAEIEAESGE